MPPLLERVFRPSMADLIPGVLLLAEFGRSSGWQSLLSDGDTGWHIRTGEYILATHSIPARDLFSFSRAGEPWYAWEWLSDVCFALLYRWHGLAAVAVFAGVLLAFAGAFLFCWLLRRGTGFIPAAVILLAAMSASTVHHLARPHVFSILLFTVGLWALDEDRRQSRPWLWALIPLTVLWTNLHGGFVCWLAMLVLLCGVSAAQRNRTALRRYGALAALCSAATLLNPYGWRLHVHILRYLASGWVTANVQEFQSPSFRSESALVFAALLLAGVALSSRAFARRRWFEAASVLLWAFAALRSARHVPLYAVAASPVIASACAAWWKEAVARRPRSTAALGWQISRDLGRSARLGACSIAFAGVILAVTVHAVPDFPPDRFPVATVTRNAALFETRQATARILTSDQWADYLIFRFYPNQRVFFDGRSDFYGPAIGAEYQALLGAAGGWRRVLHRYAFDIAVLPLDWPLAAILEQEPGWRLLDRDRQAAVFVRTPGALKKIGRTAECICGE